MKDFEVEHDSPVAAWGQILRDLRQRIERGQLAAGEQLPNERELAELYGLSRITVRQALERLARDGYINRRHGSGTFVSDKIRAVQHDLALSAPWRVNVRSQGHDATSVPTEINVVEPPPADLCQALGVSEDELAEAAAWVRYTRVHLVDGDPIGTTSSWLPRDVAETLPQPLKDGSLSESFAVVGLNPRGHVSVLESASASLAEARLLRTYTDAPLFVVKGAARAANGAIQEISATYWLGSRVRFQYDRDPTDR